MNDKDNTEAAEAVRCQRGLYSNGRAIEEPQAAGVSGECDEADLVLA